MGRVAKYCHEYVCLFVSLLAYLENRMTKLHPIFNACCLWPWLGPPLTALRYVMYFWIVDDVIFSDHRPNGPQSATMLCSEQFAMWWYQLDIRQVIRHDASRSQWHIFPSGNESMGDRGSKKAYTGPRTGIYMPTKFGCDRSIVVGCRSRND